MCEIFPEVKSCCICCSLRVGMLFICILAICTGSMILNITLKASQINLGATIATAMNTTDLHSAKSNSINIALTIAIFMGVVYVVCGFILLCANLFDEEGYIQIFVWLIFLNIIIGICGLIFMSIQCTISTCAMSSMDWLTASFILIMALVFLLWWIYFISVANSYILERTG